GVGIAPPALPLDDAAGLTPPGIVPGAPHRVAERNAFAILAVFLQRAVGEALLIAQFYAREVQNSVLHCRRNLLALAGHGALKERGDDAERQMQAGAAVA